MYEKHTLNKNTQNTIIIKIIILTKCLSSCCEHAIKCKYNFSKKERGQITRNILASLVESLRKWDIIVVVWPLPLKHLSSSRLK